MARNFWNVVDIGWSFSKSRVASGGLITFGRRILARYYKVSVGAVS